jgi:rare lipoprotein A
MKRNILALCAAVLMAGLGFGVTPAAAYVGDYDFSFSNRDGDRISKSSRAGQRSARTSRATSQRSVRNAEARPSRRGARRSPALSSLTGGSGGSGIASYYWQPQRVASGGMFNPNAMTAAHKTLAFGTKVRVTNMNNGRAVTVTINDRGPYVAGRVIDLSRAAASAVGMTGSGLARVSLAVLGR